MSKGKIISIRQESEEEEEDSREENEKEEESEQESMSNEEESEEETDKENIEANDGEGDKSGAVPDLIRKKKQHPTGENQQLQESPSEKERNKKRKFESSSPKNLFSRIWSHQDEIALLQGLSEFKGETGDDKTFFSFIKTKLSFDYTGNQVKDKVKKLRTKFLSNQNKPKTKRRSSHPLELEINRLSEVVWGGGGGASGGGTQLVPLGCYTQQATDDVQQNGSSESIGERPILNATILNASNPLEKTLKDMWELLPDSKRTKITTLWWKRKMREVQIYGDQQRLESEWANGVQEVLNAA